jgi:hypothetical protein
VIKFTSFTKETKMSNQFLNHLNSITPQGRAKDTSIFVPAKDINEAVPDVGQNIRGMPKKAGRKFAQALHNLAQDRGSLENYQAARERYTKKKASNAQRQGRNLDRAVQSFKKRMRMDEATSKGDPKRGHFGRAIPKVMPGEDPYDKYTRGEIKNFSGKLQKRLNAMSPEGRRSYYQRMGMRSRAASRGGKTQRLFPMTEAPKYVQDAIPAVPELLMLTYSNKHKRDADGLKKFVGKSKKNPMPVYEGAVKASMEDWLYDLPKGAIRELKAKHGKHLAQTGMGGKDPKGLDSSVHGILQKHGVPPLMGSHRNSVDAVKMSFHTFHGDLHESEDEKRESTKSMIARLVARGHKKIGKPIPKNVLRDIEKEHKNEDDDYEDD